MAERGSLACVGTGMMLGAHIGPRARATIEQADVVFVLMPDALAEGWIRRMNADVRSLQPFYGGGRRRSDSYRAMVAAMLAEVRAGKRVCGAFYGHPGVFAQVPHRAVGAARDEGYAAHMEPGVSAEGCLYADLGIDPGAVGCQHFETSQFMFHRRLVDPSAWLVLWQAGIAGDRTQRRFATGDVHRAMLAEKLARTYPQDHLVTLYEAATLPVARCRRDQVALSGLAGADIGMATTLAIAPACALEPDREMLARAADVESMLSARQAVMGGLAV